MKKMALPGVFEAGESVVDAVERDRIKETALVRQTQVETLLECLKKSGSHAELHRALRTGLESAKDMHRALFPAELAALRTILLNVLFKQANGET